MSSPLIDTLFRPTTAPGRVPNVASAAPVRVTGTRTRAGNAMSRTRTALMVGAARAVEASGTKITMAQVAAAAGVAKATLYNHFRTREAVLAGLLTAEVQKLVDAAADKPLDVVLVDDGARDLPAPGAAWAVVRRAGRAGRARPPRRRRRGLAARAARRPTPRSPRPGAGAATSCCGGCRRSC